LHCSRTGLPYLLRFRPDDQVQTRLGLHGQTVRQKYLLYDFHRGTRQRLVDDKQTVADQAGAVRERLPLIAKLIDYIRDRAPNIRLSLPVVSQSD